MLPFQAVSSTFAMPPALETVGVPCSDSERVLEPTAKVAKRLS